MNQAQPGAASAQPTPADPFVRTTRALRRLEDLHDRLECARQERLRELHLLVNARLAVHRELFADLLPGYERDFPDVSKQVGFEKWSVEKDMFWAEFRGSFRNEPYWLETTLPARYMTADGEAAMRVDAQALSDAQQAEAQREERARVKRERAQLRELLAKHPDVAAGGEQP